MGVLNTQEICHSRQRIPKRITEKVIISYRYRAQRYREPRMDKMRFRLALTRPRMVSWDQV